MNTLESIRDIFKSVSLATCKALIGGVSDILTALSAKSKNAPKIYATYDSWKRERPKGESTGKVEFLRACGCNIPAGKDGEKSVEYNAFNHMYRVAREELRQALAKIASESKDATVVAEARSMAADHNLKLDKSPRVKDGDDKTADGKSPKVSALAALELVFQILWNSYRLMPENLKTALAQSDETLVMHLGAFYTAWLDKTVPNWKEYKPKSKKAKPVTPPSQEQTENVQNPAA